jgi:hypothetical protein
VGVERKFSFSFKVHFVARIPPLGLATYTIEESSSASSLSSVFLYHFVGDVSVEYVIFFLITLWAMSL